MSGNSGLPGRCVLHRLAQVGRSEHGPGLENGPNELGARVRRLRHGGHHGEIALFPVVAHTGRHTLPDVQPAVARQPLEGFPQGGAGHAQLQRELTFSGQGAVDWIIAQGTGTTRSETAQDQFQNTQRDLAECG